jgi:hypothetical protein
MFPRLRVNPSSMLFQNLTVNVDQASLKKVANLHCSTAGTLFHRVDRGMSGIMRRIKVPVSLGCACDPGTVAVWRRGMAIGDPCGSGIRRL